MQTTYARPFRAIMLALLTITLSGCATLFTRPSQHVPIDSVPPAAEVFVDGTFVGTTPIMLELERRSEHTLLLRLGDKEQSVTLRSSIDGAYVALDLAPGLVMAGASALIFAAIADPSSIETDGAYSLAPALAAAAKAQAGIGIAVGLGTAAISAGVDAGTGRWYRLTPSEVLIVFD